MLSETLFFYKENKTEQISRIYVTIYIYKRTNTHKVAESEEHAEIITRGNWRYKSLLLHELALV